MLNIKIIWESNLLHNMKVMLRSPSLKITFTLDCSGLYFLHYIWI